MPAIIVHTSQGRFDRAEKDALAEELTKVILAIEGGADTPEGRSIAYVRFAESPAEDWYVGGTNTGRFVGGAGNFCIELNVPEGSMDQSRKTMCHKAITKAILKATGTTGEEDANKTVLIQIFEWPEGHLATRGRTASLLGIAKLAGIPADHPLLEYPRAYFDAKDRLYDGAEFPEGTAGRALVRY